MAHISHPPKKCNPNVMRDQHHMICRKKFLIVYIVFCFLSYQLSQCQSCYTLSIHTYLSLTLYCFFSGVLHVLNFEQIFFTLQLWWMTSQRRQMYLKPRQRWLLKPSAKRQRPQLSTDIQQSVIPIVRVNYILRERNWSRWGWKNQISLILKLSGQIGDVDAMPSTKSTPRMRNV